MGILDQRLAAKNKTAQATPVQQPLQQTSNQSKMQSPAFQQPMQNVDSVQPVASPNTTLSSMPATGMQVTSTIPFISPQPSQYNQGNAVNKKQVMESANSAVLQKRLEQIETEKKDVANKVDKEVTKISEEERVYVNEVTKTIADQFKRQVSSSSSISQALASEIEVAVARECAKLPLLYEQQKRIEKTVISGIIGLGPLEPYMNDPKVTEIIVQRWDHINVESEGKMHKVSASFTDEQHLQTVIQRIVQPIGRQINISMPIVDARLQDGSRVCAVIPPAAPDGATLDIRRFFDKALTGEDYLNYGSMTAEMLEFLQKAVQGRASIIVSGGTGTGKTTLLNMLSASIPEDEMIITIEDSCELKLESPNVRRLETRANPNAANGGMMNVDIRALVKTSLRMRPDRIIVGEIRDGTITDMVSAMSTGHEGSMCTVHANSALNLVRVRLPMLYSMSDTAFSEESQNIQIAEAIDLIVQIKRYGKLRAIQSITAIEGIEYGKVKVQHIFLYNDRENTFYATGYIPHRIIDKMMERGIYIDEEMFKPPELLKKEKLEEQDEEKRQKGEEQE